MEKFVNGFKLFLIIILANVFCNCLFDYFLPAAKERLATPNQVEVSEVTTELPAHLINPPQLEDCRDIEDWQHKYKLWMDERVEWRQEHDYWK